MATVLLLICAAGVAGEVSAAFGRQQGRSIKLMDEAAAPFVLVPRNEARGCLRRTNGRNGVPLNRKRWSQCSWKLVQQMRPAWSSLQVRGGAGASVGASECTDKTRHVTVVRYSSSADALQWLKELRGYRFTVVDKRNGEDGFAAKFGAASNGEVVLQRNQGDEASAYLARIVDNYNALSAIELFAHETELLTEDGKAMLRVADQVSARVAFVPLKRPLFTMGEVAPVGRHRRKWGNPELDDLLRRFFSWAWADENKPYDGRWSTQCCGQFITSRHQIRQRPLAFWKYLRTVANDQLLTTYTDTKRYNNGRSYFFYGHMFERLWGAMLGQTPTGTKYEKLVELEVAKAKASRAACDGPGLRQRAAP
jgi:hypothetical protein